MGRFYGGAIMTGKAIPRGTPGTGKPEPALRGNQIEKITASDRIAYSAHKDLVRKPTDRKKRRYLKCGVMILSANYGNRTCGSCTAMNSRGSARAQITPVSQGASGAHV